MARRMLIDASHPEEIRVAVINGKKLEDFDYETSRKKQIKGNVYLAKVVRVEPSLQAAFVDYGGNRHGFLAFSEIHPDYYQIPVADREQLLAEAEAEVAEDGENGTAVDTVGGDEAEEVSRPRIKHYRHYKIQEVIKRRQIMLVQVVKEERGNKGAALTTYLSLAGRYCVLMPNTSRGGGISRKIGSQQDRRRLKQMLDELNVPKGMTTIVRTAGAERTKAEIKRDYEYLIRLWDEIRTRTMVSIAPALVHEEANLIKRSIRDLYSNDIDEVTVAGEEGYRIAKDFMKAMVPSHAKRVQPYTDTEMPLFFRYQVESQIDAVHNPIVQLRSGGYLVIHSTEALVAIDVNSGRATRERHIEETALKTNLEAADEVARQLRLRDLAGLIVIDFIDMEESRNNAAVERRMKEALRNERARIQIGHISAFGLLEMSRQRLRPSLIETSSEVCRTCGGTGHIRSTDSTALHVMRGIEEEGLRRRSLEIAVFIATPVALYILNHKREGLAAIEKRYNFQVSLQADDSLIPPDFRIERLRVNEDAASVAEGGSGEIAAASAAPRPAEHAPAPSEEGQESGRRRRRSRRRRKDEPDGIAARDDAGVPARDDSGEMPDSEAEEHEQERGETTSGERVAGPETATEEGHRRRRRGKRGGRRRNRRTPEEIAAQGAGASSGFGDTGSAPTRETDSSAEVAATATEELPGTVTADITASGDAGTGTRQKRRRPPRPAARAESGATVEAEAAIAPALEAVAAETAVEPEKAGPAKKPRRKPAAPREAKTPVARAVRPPAARAEDQLFIAGAPAAEPLEPATSAVPTPIPVVSEPAVETPIAVTIQEQPATAPASAVEPVDKGPKRSGWWRRPFEK